MAAAESPLIYSEHFWGEKHHGYHILYEHLKHGEEATIELATFFKEHVALEEDVGRLLTRGAVKVGSFISAGSEFTTGWQLAKGTLELLGEIHIAFVKNLQEMSREVAKYHSEIVASRKRVKEQEVIDAVSLMQTTTTCLQKARETYSTRHAELERLRRESIVNPKELAKAENKLARAREEFRAYVAKYEVVRADFEEKMARSAAIFQAHDKAHYSSLRQFLLTFAVHQQEATVAAMQVASQFRESIQQIDIDEMLKHFVHSRGTGRDRPLPATFDELESTALPLQGHATSDGHSISSNEKALSVGADSAGSTTTGPDLLSLDPLDMWSGGGGGGSNSATGTGNVEKMSSPTASESSASTGGQLSINATASQQPQQQHQPPSTGMSASFSASLGGSRQKLAMWLPKRKKTPSMSSAETETPTGEGGGFLKFGRNNRRPSKKSTSDIPAAVAEAEATVACVDDAHSTTSSSKSEKSHHIYAGRNGIGSSSVVPHLLDMPSQQPNSAPVLSSLNFGAPPGASNAVVGDVDEEGYSIRPPDEAPTSGGGVATVEEKTEWPSCSSSEDEEEDDNEMQASRIRQLTIRPADSVPKMNAASVEELRDAIGHISLARSSTFDRDPWSSFSSATCRSPSTAAASSPFSQSMGPGMHSLRPPIRPAYTGGDEHQRKFSESEFTKSNVPLNFSASFSFAPGGGMARARPRSNTPTYTQVPAGQPGFGMAPFQPSYTGDGRLQRQESTGSTEWGSTNMLAASGSAPSGSAPLGSAPIAIGSHIGNTAGGGAASSFNSSFFSDSLNLSASTSNLLQATISEQRVPIAMALNEYSHVFFKNADLSQRTVRTFGTVLVSFAASSLPLLTASEAGGGVDLEQLQFRLEAPGRGGGGGEGDDVIRTVVPNKQLLTADSPFSSSQSSEKACDAESAVSRLRHEFAFDKQLLASWLLSQHKDNPSAAFYNVEVLRYEVREGTDPPLFCTSYWKTPSTADGTTVAYPDGKTEDTVVTSSGQQQQQQQHVDIRVDYRLNAASPLGTAPLLNLHFATKVDAQVANVTSQPKADWDARSSTLSWRLTELSLHEEGITGGGGGSLKARIFLVQGSSPPPPAPTHVQFQANDSSISNAEVSLLPSDTYHLSMVRKKVLAGKYFCDPEVRH